MPGKPRLSLLVVEDDPDLTELLCTVLSATYAVECARDVPDALASLNRRRPGLILLDCLLPGGDVTDILAKARALTCGVVLMSGLPEALAEFAASGWPCLQKPFKMAMLFDALEAAGT